MSPLVNGSVSAPQLHVAESIGWRRDSSISSPTICSWSPKSRCSGDCCTDRSS